MSKIKARCIICKRHLLPFQEKFCTECEEAMQHPRQLVIEVAGRYRKKDSLPQIIKRLFRAVRIIVGPIWVIEREPSEEKFPVSTLHGQWIMKMRQRKLPFKERLKFLMTSQKWEPFYTEPFDMASKFKGFSIGGTAMVRADDKIFAEDE